jgi:hypothetical protein
MNTANFIGLEQSIDISGRTRTVMMLQIPVQDKVCLI